MNLRKSILKNCRFVTQKAYIRHCPFFDYSVLGRKKHLLPSQCHRKSHSLLVCSLLSSFSLWVVMPLSTYCGRFSCLVFRAGRAQFPQGFALVIYFLKLIVSVLLTPESAILGWRMYCNSVERLINQGELADVTWFAFEGTEVLCQRVWHMWALCRCFVSVSVCFPLLGGWWQRDFKWNAHGIQTHSYSHLRLKSFDSRLHSKRFLDISCFWTVNLSAGRNRITDEGLQILCRPYRPVQLEEADRYRKHTSLGNVLRSPEVLPGGFSWV